MIRFFSLTFLLGLLLSTAISAESKGSLDLGFDPEREIKIIFDGSTPPKIYDVIECISKLERREPTCSLGSLTMNYYGNLRFYKLSMPGDIRVRMKSLLRNWVRRYKNADALRALVYEPELVEELQDDIVLLLQSNSREQVLPALSAASSRPELFKAELNKLQYCQDDEMALNAMRVNGESRKEFPDDLNELVLRNLFSKEQANLAVHVLLVYDQSARKLLPAIKERLDAPETTPEQRESVLYALDLVWPNGVP